MELSLASIVVALVGIVIAWKFLTGIVKTLALLGILIVAGIIVFGVMG